MRILVPPSLPPKPALESASAAEAEAASIAPVLQRIDALEKKLEDTCGALRRELDQARQAIQDLTQLAPSAAPPPQAAQAADVARSVLPPPQAAETPAQIEVPPTVSTDPAPPVETPPDAVPERPQNSEDKVSEALQKLSQSFTKPDAPREVRKEVVRTQNVQPVIPEPPKAALLARIWNYLNERPVETPPKSPGA